MIIDRTTKLKKISNARRKGNLQILGNIGSGHHQTNGDKKKRIQKEYIKRTILKVDGKRTYTNGLENKKINHDA